MDQRMQLEQDHFFNIVEPEWKGYPLLGQVHFRKRSQLPALIAGHSLEPLEQNLFFTLTEPWEQDAPLVDSDLLRKIFDCIGYPSN